MTSPTAKAPIKAGVAARRRKIPEWFWNELKEFYEGGDYTQRQLSDYAASRGFSVSQPAICQKIAKDGWIRGSKLQEMREEAEEQVGQRLGETVRDMLNRHTTSARALQGMALQHMKVAAAKAATDPNYCMPIVTLRTLTATLREAQYMEARSLGWDYNTGKPFSFGETSDDVKVEEAPRLIISEMTAKQQEEVQRRAEEEYHGEGIMPSDDELMEADIAEGGAV